jgi:hypothetical protein
MKEKEIKSCPFCGGECSVNTAEFGEYSDEKRLNGQSKFFGVNCIRCGTNNRGIIGHRTPNDAITAWNKRT